MDVGLEALGEEEPAEPSPFKDPDLAIAAPLLSSEPIAADEAAAPPTPSTCTGNAREKTCTVPLWLETASHSQPRERARE